MVSPRLPIPELLNSCLAVVSYNGGCQSADNSYDIRNVLTVDAATPHCSDFGSNFDLLLQYCGPTNSACNDNAAEQPDRFVLTHIVLRQPFQIACTCPIRTGLIWIHDTKPDLASYTKSFDNFTVPRGGDNTHSTVVQTFSNLPRGVPAPIGYFDFGTGDDEIRIQMKPWRQGRWLHIKIVSSLCSGATSGNVDIGFIGVIGYHESIVQFDSQRIWHNMKEIPDQLGVAKKKLQRFNRLHFDLVDYLHSKKALILAHSPNPENNREETAIIQAVQKVAEKGKYRHKLIFFHASVQDVLLQQMVELSIGLERFSQRDTSSPLLFVMDITSRSEGHVIFEGAKEELTQSSTIEAFCKSVVKSKARIFIRSAPRPLNDRHPDHPDLFMFTALTFKELVMDTKKPKDVLVIVSASWSTPCVVAVQTLALLAQLMKGVPDICIGMLDFDANDFRILGHFPEQSIPIIKLFRAKNKQRPVVYDGDRSLTNLIRFLHSNSKTPFDQRLLLQQAKKLSAINDINPKVDSLVREATSHLNVVQSSPTLQEISNTAQRRIDELRRMRTDCEQAIINSNELPSEMMLALGAKMEELREVMQPLREEADKIRRRNVRQIQSADEFAQEIASGMVVCKFTAKWCLPCKKIAPIFAEFSLEFTDVRFIELDIEQLPEVARQYRVQAYPTFKFFRGNAEVAEVQGADSGALHACIKKNRI